MSIFDEKAHLKMTRKPCHECGNDAVAIDEDETVSFDEKGFVLNDESNFGGQVRMRCLRCGHVTPWFKTTLQDDRYEDMVRAWNGEDEANDIK